MKKEIFFYSESCKIAGDLYLPDHFQEDQKSPAVVLCHGFAGIKEVLLPPFAEAFAQNGFVSLVFDYRGFGASEGERGRLFYPEQVRDIRNAITYLQSVPGVDSDRIGLWGTSYGGANAIACAAEDSRVKCLTAQLTFGDGERVITSGLTPEAKDKLNATLTKVWTKAVTQNKSMALPPVQILTDEQSKTFLTQMIDKMPQVNTKIPMLFIKYTMEYKPEQVISRLKIPVLLIAAEKDSVNPPEESRSLLAKANEPKKLHMIGGATHYECYEGEKFQQASDQAVEWFKRFI